MKKKYLYHFYNILFYIGFASFFFMFGAKDRMIAYSGLLEFDLHWFMSMILTIVGYTIRDKYK
jgi:hypothetical protein